jgi:hypothetical protein
LKLSNHYALNRSVSVPCFYAINRTHALLLNLTQFVGKGRQQPMHPHAGCCSVQIDALQDADAARVVCALESYDQKFFKPMHDMYNLLFII